MSNYDSKYYFTLDNGGRPFMVDIIKKGINQNINVFVYKKDNNYSDYDDNDEIENSYTENVETFYDIKEVFIGKSTINKMTEYSCGYGSKFDGNSILLKINDENEYVFIGHKIFSFQTDKKIIKFVSDVGNSSVPYPYAIDEDDSYYFLLKCAILKDPLIKYEIEVKKDNPYIYFYSLIRNIKESENIENLIINDHTYRITTNPDPEADYNDLINRIGNPIYIKRPNKEKQIINKNEYIELLTKYNEKIGLRKLNIEIIQERLY